ncbi:MAG TPA: hypothetical protein VIK93_11900 [Limnochordales bacterium]
MSCPAGGWGAPSGDAHLVASILSRYPEIGSLEYCPDSQQFTFSFLITATGLNIPAFRERLKESLQAYSFLTGHAVDLLVIDWIEEAGVTLLRIVRDLPTLRHEELALLVGLVQQEFGDLIACEAGGSSPELDGPMQEELIQHMLEDLRDAPLSRELIGFRREGRVVVYHRQPAAAKPRR